METNEEIGTSWEGFVKVLFHRLDIPTKGDIQDLHHRLDRLEQLIYQKPLGMKKEPVQKTAKKKSASAIVLEVISNYADGTNFKTIKAATGYDDKKLRNIIFRLDKIGKIEKVRRGIYKKI